MGWAWREIREGEPFESMLAMVRGVRALGLEACVTAGMLTDGQAARLAEAGLTAYNHNLDTSPEYYSRIISTRTYQERLETLARVRSAGISLCCGGILGMGESRADRAGLLTVLATMDPHPESVPINALVAVEGTPLEEQPTAGSPGVGSDGGHSPDPHAHQSCAAQCRPGADESRSPDPLSAGRGRFDLLRRLPAHHGEPRRGGRPRAAGGGGRGDCLTMWVAAFYRFTPFTGEELGPLRERLEALAAAADLKGTLLLAPEGVNGALSGSRSELNTFFSAMGRDPRLADLDVKTSWCPDRAFHRLKVRIKREIVSLGRPEVNPNEAVGTYVAPQEWDALIQDPGTLLIDTRNDYEVALGSFEAAIDPGTRRFRDFPDWVERHLIPALDHTPPQRRPQRLALFCTGGIRCEKATSYLLAQRLPGGSPPAGRDSPLPRADSPSSRAAGVVSALFSINGWP